MKNVGSKYSIDKKKEVSEEVEYYFAFIHKTLIKKQKIMCKKNLSSAVSIRYCSSAIVYFNVMKFDSIFMIYFYSL